MNNWVIEQKKFSKEDIKFFESIFSLGNGYMGVGGYDEEESKEAKHEFNTFIAGVFDYYMPGKTDMVNTPNYWRTGIYINGERFSHGYGKIVEFCKELNMKEGILRRKLVWENNQGNKTLIETTKFLCMDSVHNAIMSIKLSPLNYSGNITIETGVDADVWNCVIDDDQMKTDENVSRFLAEDGSSVNIDDIHLIRLKTVGTDFKIYEGFTTEVLHKGNKLNVGHSVLTQTKYVEDKFTLPVAEGEFYIFNKYISVWTSRDQCDTSLQEQVVASLKSARNKGFDSMLRNHAAAWSEKWKVSDVEIIGDDECQRAMRYNIFQLIQTNAENDPHVNIGARGIMHGRYKGCYFWDTEIFMLPFYLYTNPKAAKNLLLYRYHTLRGAQENAKRQNLEGARFAWMSALDGLDQCDTWDIGLSEVHITADIAYAVNQYFDATNDIEFIRDYGLEILIQTSRYWKSRFTYDSCNDCYNMLFVKGPNEYGGVINNNLFTVMMATYNIKSAKKYIQLVKADYPEEYHNLVEKISFAEEEVSAWDHIIKNVVINYDKSKSLYLEDDNFLKLEPLELGKIKNGDEPLYKKICFDRLQRYRVLKQADVILLMLLLPKKFSAVEQQAAWNYYEPLTTHDSSLSYGTHSTFAAKLKHLEEAYEYFLKSVNLDLKNIMDNTQKEGIHFAALGASWQAVINGFSGIELVDGNLIINPNMPKQWEKLSFRLYYHQCLLKFSISQNNISVTYEEGNPEDIEITAVDRVLHLVKGKKAIISFDAQEDC